MPDMNMMGAMPKPDNHEAAMARADLYKLANYSFKLFKMVKDGDELEGWVQAKITKAADYIASVYHFMEYEMKFSEYGEKLETADVYTESVKREYKRKLTEARVKLEKLRQKNIADLNEGWEDMVKATKERGEKEKKEQGTGKFDKKELAPGVTRYTKKSSTFDDGKDDKREAEKKQQRKDDRAAKKANQSSVKEGSIQGGVWTADAPKKGAPNVPVPQDIDGGSAAPLKPGQPGYAQQMMKQRQAPKVSMDPAKRGVAPSSSKRTAGADTMEALKGGQKKLDVDGDGTLEKSDFAKLRAKKVKEAEDKKCNHTPKGKSCPVHGLKECGTMESIVSEKAVSKAQQKFMGMVHATKKGEKAPSKEVAKAAKGMSAKAAKDYASTKHKGLPAKKD